MKRRIWIVGLLLFVLCAGVFAAGTEEAAGPREVIEIEAFGRNAHHSNVPFAEDDKVVEYIGNKLGLKIKVINTPASEYNQKLGLMIAAGNIPDVMTTFAKAGGAGTELYKTLRDAGKLVNMSEAAATGKYPNMKKLFDDGFAQMYSAEPDGSFYELPSYYGLWPHAWYIRGDWLDDLGIEKPDTLNETYEALKRFVREDPDGKKNIGFTTGGVWWFGHVYAGFTGAMDWAVRDGKFVDVWTLPEQREAVEFMAKLNSEGLLDKDIFTGQGSEHVAKFSSGKAGVLIVDFVYLNQIEKALADINPTSRVDLLPTDIRGPKGIARMGGQTPYFSSHAISSDTKDPERVLELFEYLLSDEAAEITIMGVPGVHYTMEGGKRVPNEEILKHENWGLPGLRSRHRISSLVTLDQWYDPANYLNPGLIDYFFNTLKDPSFPGKIGTNATTGLDVADVRKEIGSKTADVKNKWEAAFILGEKSISEHWDDFVAEYRAAGVDKLEEAYNARYKP